MKTFFLILLSIISNPILYSQEITDKVPYLVQASFIKIFPDAGTPVWMEESKIYKASYESNGRARTVWFDENGKWLKRESAILIEGLPPLAIDYLSARGFNMGQLKVIKILEAGAKVYYRVLYNDTAYLFSRTGELENP